jgi:type IV pilus assembly protein PilB
MVTEEIERLTVERAPSTRISQTAIAQGMQPLRADGLAKARAGLTAIEEVLRVVV